ncbi:selenocysteine-specific translation elongation factor [Methanopyrus sp. KOL6]|uniref:selenocysteine-specific translation elongation factor n=1 Tax=Methanopyrus sp. KOL6 TaxID=1937004 RepID=UPI0018E04F5E|nr:selenocysteine-specific translation elongation factor [Methanopyrus sp. KOL6]
MPIVHVGLFGHIDHGKTALAAQLTEKPSTAALDKHPEEKERGITIDLGFSSFELGDYTVTLVDAPGHADLIRTVVAGAEIIDAAILVVAADEGPQVQTGEHLVVLNHLGIDRGVVALNKVDLVDEKTVERRIEEIKRVLQGTALEDAPIIPVSAKTGEGIENLKDALLEVLEPSDRDLDSPFRMPIDHAFHVKGAGTVVTGTVLTGRVEVGDELTLYPIGKTVEVKSIQSFGKDKQEARAGDRVGIALRGVREEEIERGFQLAEQGSLRVTRYLDLKVEMDPLFSQSIGQKTMLHIHVGMRSVPARVVPHDDGFLLDSLRPGESSYLHAKLNEPVAVKEGDRTILVKLDLPPTTLRIAGSGLVEGTSKRETFKRVSRRRGRVTRADHMGKGLAVVDGLALNKEHAKRLVGERVSTEGGVEGKIVDTHGTRGAVLVDFDGEVKTGERVVLERVRNVKIVL